MITQERRLEILEAIRSLAAFPYNVYPGSALDSKLIELVRELWPVRAKPLDWSEISEGIWFGDNRMGDSYLVIDHGEGRFKAQWFKTMLLFDSLDRAKQACEDHQQARFLEQLA